MEKNFHYLFPMTSTTATVLLILRNDVDPEASKILLGTRVDSAEVYPGYPCVPGGFLDAKYGDRPGECARQTAVREVMEETNITITKDQLVLFQEYSDPGQDKRAHVTSLCYYAEITPEQAEAAKAGDDLKEIGWFWVGGEIPQLAFNHNTIVRDGLKAWRKELLFKELMDSRKPAEDLASPAIVKTRRDVGLAVMRAQPLHKGHTRIIDAMIQDSDVAIIGMGSCNVSRTVHDPFTPEERKEMIRNVYGDRVKIIMLSDLGITPGKDDWVDYVLSKIHKLGLPAPSDYYSGSFQDSLWYSNYFFNEKNYKEPKPTHYDDFGNLKKLNILDRTEFPISASMVRDSLILMDESWRELIPRVNHTIVEKCFPEKFRIRV